MVQDGRDADAERARLEQLAWGSGSSPAEAARARIALADLDAGRRPRPRSTVRPGASPAPTAPDRAAVPDPAAAPVSAAPTEADQPGGPDVPDTAPGGTAEVGAAAGAEPGLPSGRTSAWRRLRTMRGRALVGVAAAAAVGVAFAGGLAVGTAGPATPAAPSITPTPGAVTLQQRLDQPQMWGDRLPGSVRAPVSLQTTRLVFSNRALDGDDSGTPWDVWAGVGTDRSTICIVATADRIETTTACYPKEDALHGAVSMTAETLSGTLSLQVTGGGVQGTVTNGL